MSTTFSSFSSFFYIFFSFAVKSSHFYHKILYANF